MNFMNRMEKKFGKYAIPDLPMIIIITYIIGYVLEQVSPRLLFQLTLEPYYILRGQIWRLLTWVLIPPGTLDLLTIIMLLFYYSIATALERTWGRFRFNVYIFSGILFTIIGAFLLYFYQMASGQGLYSVGLYFSTYYISMSMYLAIAVTYPNMEVLLYFIIPVKMKWMALLYVVVTFYTMTRNSLAGNVAIIASLLNFIVFFLSTRNYKHYAPGEVKRRQDFKRAVHPKISPERGATIHKCYICGRTEKDSPELQFRYCSKCDGAYEYCQDHLFTHTHIHSSTQ